MKKNTLSDKEVLDLISEILPKATKDPKLSQKILGAVERELTHKSQAAAFLDYCRTCPLPNLASSTLKEITSRFEETFGKNNVDFVVDKASNQLRVELNLPGVSLSGVVPVNTIPMDGEEEPEVKLKFIPFPVVLETDQELVWMMAKKENLSPEEATRALFEVIAEFWETKSGQNALRKGAERNFAEFIQRVPAKMLTEVGLKRHYKEGEALQVLKQPKESA